VTFIHLTPDQPVARVADTTTGALGLLGARFVMEGDDAERRFALVEHPIAPRGLACPIHTHSREDEYSFILEGEWGFLMGETVVYGRPGDLVYKPRNIPHAFWNASVQPARLLEIISPSGFEHYFAELAELFAANDPDQTEQFVELNARYGLAMDFDSVPGLIKAHNVTAGDVIAS
jgi:uncharacterized cupin superfamily protein